MITSVPRAHLLSSRSIKPGLDPGLDSGPWTLDSGFPIKIDKMGYLRHRERLCVLNRTVST